MEVGGLLRVLKENWKDNRNPLFLFCVFCGGFPLKKYTHLYVPWSKELVPLLVGRDGAQTPWILDNIRFLVMTMIQGISTVAHMRPEMLQQAIVTLLEQTLHRGNRIISPGLLTTCFD